MFRKKELAPFILLVILALIWGTSFILIKRGLVAFSAGEVAALRVTAASFFLLPIALTQLRELTLKDYAKLMASGLMGIFIPAFLFSFAQMHIDSSIAGIMYSLTPIWTMLIGAALFGQRFTGYTILGTLIGFGGTLLLVMAKSEGITGGINGYALLVVVATLLYGINLNFIKYKIEHIRSITITSISVLMIAPFALIYLLFFTEFVPKLTTHEGAFKAFGYVALLGLMSTAFAVVLFNRLVKTHSPLFASSVTYLIPIVAVMWGVLDGEHLFTGHYIGMILIISGVYLANRKG